MTSVPPPAASGAGTAPVDGVVAAMSGLGVPVDCASTRSQPLEGPHVLWLVVDGAMDLFAVDAGSQGRWHFLGRLEPGTLLLGPVEGPRHTLVGRPLRDCVLHRIPLRELFKPEQGAYGYDQYGNPMGDTGEWSYGDTGEWSYDQTQALSPLEDAFARGIGRGLRTVFEANVEGDEAGDDTIMWMPVEPGSLQYGTGYGQDTAPTLLIDGAMWQRMVNQQTRLLLGLDRWIERVERAHEDRTAAGIKAGEAVRAQADQALLASIDRSGRAARPSRGTDDATLAACRLVGAVAGITITAPTEGGTLSDRMSPVERVAVSSRFRTRVVRLGDHWWRENTGPLVGYKAASGSPVALLWRRGGYESVEPVSGRRTRVGKANAGQFEDRAVMFYRPLPERPLSAWRLLRFSLRGTKLDVGNLMLGGLIAVGLGALVPVATGQVLGVFVPNAQNGFIVDTSLAIVASTIVAAAFMLLENVAILRMEGRIEATLQPAVWDRLLRLPTKFFAGRSTGELASAAMGISAIRRVLSGISSVTAQACTVGAVNFGLLLYFSPALTLMALAMLVISGGVFLGMGLWQLRWQRRLIVLNNKLNNQAFQTLRGLPKLRVAAAESFAYAAWAGEFARSRELQRRVGRMKNLITVFNAVYLPLCTLIMFMLLAGPARGTLSASGFLTFNTSVTMLLTAVTQLTGALVSAASVLPLFEQLKPVLDEVPEVAGAQHRAGPAVRRDRGQAPVLPVRRRRPAGAGRRVASRCGRASSWRSSGPAAAASRPCCGCSSASTSPLSGGVLYDGQDLAALDQAAVRRQCGVVLQNAQPFSGSLLDCICGAEIFTLEEAWEAAEMAGLAEDIKRMPMGMHTVLSDGGGTISGGQRQRLMIAQALIRRPRVLFFDEATSALDNETQRIVIESTRKLHATRVVIAHRLSTIMDADRVVVMSEGRVLQQGPPADLLAETGGVFHELVRRQIR